jgi:hypothetical protein
MAVRAASKFKAGKSIPFLLDEQDTPQGVAVALREKASFRTWSNMGLRGRAKSDYYTGFRFDNPGRLPTDKRVLFLLATDAIEYAVFIADTPVAWYDGKTWTAPELSDFSEFGVLEYQKVREALLAIGAIGVLT